MSPSRRTIRPSAPPPAFKSVVLAASVAACALALALTPASARAQDGDEDDDDGPAAPIVVEINGPCALMVDGAAVPCSGVAYMVFPSNHRIDFAAITETAGWAFSGDDDDKDGGAYALELDSVLNPAAGRLEAEGECRMDLADDRRTVRSLDCQAMTEDGEVTLAASGVIAVMNRGEDLDDDLDDGPDPG